MMSRKKLLVITGPTAAGKSAFIYETLRHESLTIINADSRQVYRDFAISSASPGPSDKANFPHELYNFLPVTETFSAGEFCRRARQEIDQAHAGGRVPVVCGGTYFYLHALFTGLLPAVKIADSIRNEVEQLSGAEAYARLQDLDATAAHKIHPHNFVRVQRALMLCLAHAQPISSITRQDGILHEYEIMMLIFDMEKDALRQRVQERVGHMFAAGIVAEVDSVFGRLEPAQVETWRQIPALTGIGVREFFEFFERTGKRPAELSAHELESLKTEIAQDTQHLVKRQRTWMRNATPKPANTKTVDPSYENERIASLIRDFLK